MSSRSLIVAGSLMELCYISFFFVVPSPHEVLLFIAVHVVTFGVLAYLAYLLRKQTAALPGESVPTKPLKRSGIPARVFSTGQRSGLHLNAVIIVGFAILFRLTLVSHVPVASDDIYRYIWDGKVAAHGINPFRYAPTDPSLTVLHTTDLPAKVNHPEMRTIYPPLAQAVFLASHFLFGDSLSGLKFLLILADVASILLLLAILRLVPRALPRETVLLYAWSPLPILYFGLDGHVDALGIPLLLAALFSAMRSRVVATALSVGLAALAKVHPLLIAPMLVHITKGWKRWLLPVVPLAVFASVCAFYYEQTGGLLESFLVFSTRWEFNGSVFMLVYHLVQANEIAHLVCMALFGAWLVWVFVGKRLFLERVFLGFLGLIMFSATVHPWYLTWLAALVVLRWSTATFVLLGLSVLSNVVVYQYQASGLWTDRPLVALIEYAPFYALLVRELMGPKTGKLPEAPKG